jgi:hypothetical protein
MFSLSYKIEYAIDERYPMSPPSVGNCLGVLCPSEEYANNMLDLLAKRGTILETNLVELENYTPSKRVVVATTRSWE